MKSELQQTGMMMSSWHMTSTLPKTPCVIVQAHGKRFQRCPDILRAGSGLQHTL